MKRILQIGLVLALVAASVVGLLALRAHHTRLRQQAAESARSERALKELRAEHTRLKTLVIHTERAGAEADAARRAELERTRDKVRAIEQRALERRAQAGARAAAEAEVLATNRDPEKGLMRTVHFQNVGRASPAAAFQTLVWAAVQGEDAMLADAFHITDVVREKAEALLARLPAAAREIYPTPEKLAALFFSAEILAKTSTLHIVSQQQHDATHATVRVRSGAAATEVPLPLQRTDRGWQMVVTERQIEGIEGQLRGNPSRGKP